MRLWLRLQLLLLSCALCLSAGGPARAASFQMSPAELAEFAAAAGQKVPEIQRARRLAEDRYAMLATYGATSRELLFFVQEKAEALGSRDGFRLWLADQESLPLLSFHRLGTPLEFLLIPRAKNNSENRAKELKALIGAIQAELPGNILYAKPSVRLSQEIPSYERAHYEALDHIVLSERGLERLPILNVTANGQEINLSDWGLRQLASETLIFLKNAAPGLPAKPNAEEDLSQVLRWIAAQSAYPSLKVPESSVTQLRELLLRVTLLPGYAKLFQKPGKVLNSLEELQLASPDPARTRALLDDYGVSALARNAGAEAKLREALPASAEGEAEEGEALGEDTTFLRRVPLTYAQAIAAGALPRERLNGGPAGFYLSANTDSLTRDDIYLEFTVAGSARAGVDFVRHEDYFVILHRGALAKNGDGSPRISAVNHDFIVRQQAERLRQLKTQASAPANESIEVQHALGALLDPLRNSADARAFRELWTLNGGNRAANGPLLDVLLSRAEMLRETFRTADPFWRALLSHLRMEPKEESPAVAAVKAFSIKENPAVMKALVVGPRTRSALLAYPEALARVREIQPEQWGTYLDGLVADKTFRATYLSEDLSHPADLAFLRRLSAHPELFAGLPAPIITAAQAANLESFASETLNALLDPSLQAEVPLPRALNPNYPTELALLQKLAGHAPDRWSRVDWLGRSFLDAGVRSFVKAKHPELWTKVLSDSLLSSYPAAGEQKVYQFDASPADQEAIRTFLATSAKEFGAEPTLEKAFNPLLTAQAEYRRVLMAEFPALSAGVPVHRMKAYAERLLCDEGALDTLFALMREKAKNTADLMAIVDPELKDVNFPSESVKASYLRRLQQIAREENSHFEKLARSPFQKDAWKELVGSLGTPVKASESGRMPASIAPSR
jgi:hypothetical protein